MDAAPFQAPPIRGATVEGWLEEILDYSVSPKPRGRQRTFPDAEALFGQRHASAVRVITRARDAAEGERCLQLRVFQQLNGAALEEDLHCVRHGVGILASRLRRDVRTKRGRHVRQEEVDFLHGHIKLPLTTYPDVLLPFLLRGQISERSRRSAHSWTSDRFIAQVDYEPTRETRIRVPAGDFEGIEVLITPNMDDRMPLGGIFGTLAKPLLPRYDLCFEAAPPHRLLRFEGPYGPPGAPEIIMELTRG